MPKLKAEGPLDDILQNYHLFPGFMLFDFVFILNPER